MKILNQIGKVELHSDLNNQFVVRDGAKADPFEDDLININGSSSYILDSYLLGDVNGSWEQI